MKNTYTSPSNLPISLKIVKKEKKVHMSSNWLWLQFKTIFKVRVQYLDWTVQYLQSSIWEKIEAFPKDIKEDETISQMMTRLSDDNQVKKFMEEVDAFIKDTTTQSDKDFRSSL